MPLPDAMEWLSSPSSVKTSREPPPARPVDASQPGDAVGAAASGADAISQKHVVIAGVLGLGALVASTIYQAQRENAAQILFINGYDAPSEAGDSISETKHIVFVNLNSRWHSLALAALDSWMPAADGKVKTSFQPVTVIEERGDEGVRTVAESARRAALSSFAELRSSMRDLSCVAVLRSAISVNQDGLELMESNEQTVSRAHGKIYHERQALAYTTDGAGAEVIIMDTVGVIDSSLLNVLWDDPAQVAAADVASVLRGCCVATHGTLHQHTLEQRMHGALAFDGLTTMGEAARSSAAYRRSALDDTRRLRQHCEHSFVSEHCALWQLPFLAFWEFAARMRLGTRAYGGVRKLSSKHGKPGALGSALNTLINRVRGQAVDIPEVTEVPLAGSFVSVYEAAGALTDVLANAVADSVTSVVETALGKHTVRYEDGPLSALVENNSLLSFVPGDAERVHAVLDLRPLHHTCSLYQAQQVTLRVVTVLSAAGLHVKWFGLYVMRSALDWQAPWCSGRSVGDTSTATCVHRTRHSVLLPRGVGAKEVVEALWMDKGVPCGAEDLPIHEGGEGNDNEFLCLIKQQL